MELRKAKVVMLPTKDTNPPLHKGRDGKLRVSHTPFPYEFPQHLYVIIDDIVDKGEYYYSKLGEKYNQQIRKSEYNRGSL